MTNRRNCTILVRVRAGVVMDQLKQFHAKDERGDGWMGNPVGRRGVAAQSCTSRVLAALLHTSPGSL